MKHILFPLVALLLSLSACNPSTGNRMNPSVSIQSIVFPKAFFNPGEPARWHITLKSNEPVSIILFTTITYLDKILEKKQQNVELESGTSTIEGNWIPPRDSPRGYGVDIRLQTLQGAVIASYSSAFDVLENWTQNPRYGFLTDFSPDRTDESQTMDGLLRYHINGLQFYDWMYRHDQYLTQEDPYFDPLGRYLSLRTVKALIEAAHVRGMAAMPYTAVYSASIPFFELHKDWALYKIDGTPYFFGDNFLVIMDPRPDTPWTKHLLGEFSNILAKTEFDGIHLDQYYSPQVGYDAQGNSFSLEQPLADLINATKDIVTATRGEKGAVIFNAVTNWPIETVAPSNEDVVYIEVWSPYTYFYELGLLINQAQQLGGGKPVVLAAYIDPQYKTNVLLNDAIIFANGGGHIELGEHGDYLADAYFPRYLTPDAELAVALQRYYEYTIRYQNAIGPQTRSSNQAYSGRISLGDGIETNPASTRNMVMPVVRESKGYTAISLINLLGLETGEWARGTLTEPTSQSSTKVNISGISRKICQIWFSTPDAADFTLQPLNFTQSDNLLTITIPYLEYWDMILIKWSD
jgi:dextranase